MKKLYTLLCAVAVTAMAASAAAPKLQRSVMTDRQLNTEVSVNKAYAATTAAKPTLKMNAPAKAALEYGDITGEYLFCGAYVGEPAPLALNAKVAKGAAENEYTIEITDMGSKQLKATVAEEDVKFSDGTYKVPVLSIAGNGTQLFAEAQGSKFYFWTVGYTDKGFVRYSDDFQLMVIDGELIPMYNYGIGWLSTEGRGNGQATTEPYKVNALAATSAAGNTGYSDLEENLYAAYGSATKTITLVGVAGFGTPVKVAYDDDMEAYVARGVTIYKAYNDDDQSDNTVYDIDIWSSLPAAGNQEAGYYGVLVFASMSDNEYTFLQSPYEFVGMCNTEVAAMQGWWFKYKDYTVRMPLLSSIDAGVKDINTDAAVDADAPVEYFNLQGVRVAEPAAGLYIRRQGKTVSKVVIR